MRRGGTKPGGMQLLTGLAFEFAAVLDRDEFQRPVLGIDGHLADGDDRLETCECAQSASVEARRGCTGGGADLLRPVPGRRACP